MSSVTDPSVVSFVFLKRHAPTESQAENSVPEPDPAAAVLVAEANPCESKSESVVSEQGQDAVDRAAVLVAEANPCESKSESVVAEPAAVGMAAANSSDVSAPAAADAVDPEVAALSGKSATAAQAAREDFQEFAQEVARESAREAVRESAREAVRESARKFVRKAAAARKEAAKAAAQPEDASASADEAASSVSVHPGQPPAEEECPASNADIVRHFEQVSMDNTKLFNRICWLSQQPIKKYAIELWGLDCVPNETYRPVGFTVFEKTVDEAKVKSLLEEWRPPRDECDPNLKFQPVVPNLFRSNIDYFPNSCGELNKLNDAQIEEASRFAFMEELKAATKPLSTLLHNARVIQRLLRMILAQCEDDPSKQKELTDRVKQINEQIQAIKMRYPDVSFLMQ